LRRARPTTYPLSLHDALPISIAGNAGGGAISIGDSAGQDTVSVDNELTVASGASITAIHDLTIGSHSDLRPQVFSSTDQGGFIGDRKSTRLNSSHGSISYAVF